MEDPVKESKIIGGKLESLNGCYNTGGIIACEVECDNTLIHSSTVKVSVMPQAKNRYPINSNCILQTVELGMYVCT